MWSGGGAQRPVGRHVGGGTGGWGPLRHPQPVTHAFRCRINATAANVKQTTMAGREIACENRPATFIIDITFRLAATVAVWVGYNIHGNPLEFFIRINQKNSKPVLDKSDLS